MVASSTDQGSRALGAATGQRAEPADRQRVQVGGHLTPYGRQEPLSLA